MINNIKLSATPIKPISEKEEIQQSKPGFGKIKLTEKPDSFESPTNVKRRSWLEIALMATTGASITALALFRGKLGKALILVGEKPPTTIMGRIKKISELSAIDDLTKLFNRKALDANIIKEYKKAVKNNKNLSVAMLDMDNFKGINELLSHDHGDTVLKRIASNIQEIATKNGAKSYRYGGEEFVVTITDKDPAASHKIIAEIAEAIKKDQVITGLLPQFNKNAKRDLDFIKPQISKLNSMFSKLRGETKIENHQELADEIVALIETHIKKYEPADTKNLDTLMTTIKSAKPEDLPEILKAKTIVEPDGTIGKELDKIQNSYINAKNDIEKWVRHLIDHKTFTISGGVVNIKDASLIKDGKSFVEVADAALKSAKENNKNQIVIANDDIIKKAIEQINKNKKQNKP